MFISTHPPHSSRESQEYFKVPFEEINELVVLKALW